MTAEEFARWSVHSVEGFVRQQMDAGLQAEPDARRDAARIFAEQLPEGRDTRRHHLLTVRDLAGGAAVGGLWLRVRPGAGEVEAFLLDIDLLPPARGRGVGRATMLAAHESARGLGATVMRLNVFGHNVPAIALYRSLGYGAEEITLHRRPGDPLPPARDLELRPMTPRQLTGLEALLEEPGARPLPDGLGTPGQLFWTAYDGADPVAAVWLGLADRSDGLHASIRRLEVRDDLRRRGYGRAVGVAVLRACREMRVRAVVLSLDGADAPAHALVDELGFTLTAQTMTRPLTDP
jgi:ribosomal protein S18 acetylase RimI-like enzyme